MAVPNYTRLCACWWCHAVGTAWGHLPTTGRETSCCVFLLVVSVSAHIHTHHMQLFDKCGKDSDDVCVCVPPLSASIHNEPLRSFYWTHQPLLAGTPSVSGSHSESMVGVIFCLQWIPQHGRWDGVSWWNTVCPDSNFHIHPLWLAAAEAVDMFSSCHILLSSVANTRAEVLHALWEPPCVLCCPQNAVVDRYVTPMAYIHQDQPGLADAVTSVLTEALVRDVQHVCAI